MAMVFTHSGMLCVEVCPGGEDTCRGDSAVTLSIGAAQSWKAWIDATIRELKRLESTLETIYTPGKRMDAVNRTAMALILWSVTCPWAPIPPRVVLSSTEGSAASKTAYIAAAAYTFR
jgi:hypothetical protein